MRLLTSILVSIGIPPRSDSRIFHVSHTTLLLLCLVYCMQSPKTRIRSIGTSISRTLYYLMQLHSFDSYCMCRRSPTRAPPGQSPYSTDSASTIATPIATPSVQIEECVPENTYLLHYWEVRSGEAEISSNSSLSHFLNRGEFEE